MWTRPWTFRPATARRRPVPEGAPRTPLLPGQLPDPPFVRDHVELAVGVLSERGHAAEALDRPLRRLHRSTVPPAERSQPTVAVVRVEDRPGESGHRAAA